MFKVFNHKYDPSSLLCLSTDTSKLEQKDIARCFARLFSTEDGKIVLSHLQSITFQRAHSCHAPEAELRHSEGQRALVAQILRLIDRGRNE